MSAGGLTGRGKSRLGSQEFGHVGTDRVERLHAERLAKRGPSGIFGMTSPPSKVAIRRSVEAGICPMCGRGPYKVVSVHTNKIHGVDKFELREMAGMTSREPTCLPEFSERAREIAVSGGTAARLPRGAARGPHRLTSAGREKVSAGSGSRWEPVSVEDRREWASRLSAKAQEVRRAALKPCGTTAAYARGCRCEPCRAAESARRKARRS